MKPKNKLENLFQKKAFFTQALTHRSWVNENPGRHDKNERLEFLGDAVLEFVVSDVIYRKFPEKEEGYLTALRSQIVNTTSLAETARNLGVGQHLLLSKGEEDTGGRENTSILADATEAIIGALYIDQGVEAARSFIDEFILNNLDERIKEPLKDPKSSLQEKVQAEGLPTPRYVVSKETGPSHDKEFIVKVIVGEQTLARGRGKSKSEAEKQAAQGALVKLRK